MKPKVLPLRRFAIAALAAAASLAGCDDRRVAGGALETEDPNFIEGRRLEGEERNEAALECFTKVILSRASSPEAHLEAGNLCLEPPIRDPLAAIFHFRQYVKQSAVLTPQRRSLIDGRIRAAEREFLRRADLPFKPVEGAGIGNDALLEQIKTLRAENDMLKRRQGELVAAAAKPAPVVLRPPEDREDASGPAATPTPPVSAAATPAPAGTTRRYVIASGDTLSKISRKVYGTPAKWQKILNANPDRIPTANTKLRIGEEIKIPE